MRHAQPCCVVTVWISSMASMVMAAWIAPAAAAIEPVVVYETEDPFDGPFGLWGMDVFSQQSVGARFTPDAHYDLASVAIWFMNNSDTQHPTVHVSLQTDADGTSAPSGVVLESWDLQISTLGWNPVLEFLDSRAAPHLEAGANYWVVAESGAAGGEDAVWNFASAGSGYTANNNPLMNPDWSGGPGAALAMFIMGTPPPCPADLDGSGDVGFGDLLQLLGAWGPCPGCPEDLDDSGDVGFGDLLVLLGAWGGCG